ncbi:MAG TPA: hypothetical protein VEI03_10595 [Stellaceae bacterium]|nr:hypothetical protein [Stellaceae bacterium]
MIPTRPVLLLLCLACAFPAFAKGPPKPLPDWPCDTPFAGPLEPAMLWPGAVPPEGDWREDAAARALVDFLTASENSPAMGEREIADYAEKNGPVPRQTALRVVAGMVERGNVLRKILLKGIKDQIIRSHVLAEAVAENAAGIEAAEKQSSEDGTRQAAALKEARRQNLNGLDDADDTAESLCHRLVYDETKLRRLATALKAHAQQPAAVDPVPQR